MSTKLGVGRRAAGVGLAAVAAFALTVASAPAATYPNPPPDFGHLSSPHKPLYSQAGGDLDRPMLVVRVNFSDVSPNQAQDAANIADRFFGGFPSVTDYFYDESSGRLDIDPAAETETSDNGAISDGVVSAHLQMTRAQWRALPNGQKARTALLALADQDVNFSVFDTNGDNQITNRELLISTIEADPDPAGFVQDPNAGSGVGPGFNGCGVIEYMDAVSFDTKTIAQDFPVAYTASDTNLITAIHELGHAAWQMDDAYGWDIYAYDIATGTCGAADSTLFGLATWQAMHLDWISPEVVTQDGFYQAGLMKTIGDSFILYDPDQGEDDYFIVENRVRAPGTYDQAINDTGLVIWRIDHGQWSNISGTSPDKTTGPVYLVRPGASKDGDKLAWDPGDPNTPQRAMAEPWRDGTASNVAVRAIGNASDSTCTYFDVRGPGGLIDTYPLDKGGAADPSELEQLSGGAAKTLDFPVRNTGEAPDTFEFTVTGLPAGWTASTDTMTLGAGAESTAHIAVTPAAAAAPGTYELNTVARSTATGATYPGCGFTVLVVPQVSIDDVFVVEGPGGSATNAVFTVSLSGPSPVPTQVQFTTADGTATAGSDYVGLNANAPFAPGETSTTLEVPVLGDFVDEPDETFFANLHTPDGLAIADGQGVATILDDDRNGSFSCQGQALRVGSTANAVANPPNSPCRDDAAHLNSSSQGVSGLRVTAETLQAATDERPNGLAATAPMLGDRGAGESSVEKLVLRAGLSRIVIRGIAARAEASCQFDLFAGLTPVLESSSAVASLKVGAALPKNVGSNPLVLAVAGFGTLHLNDETVSGGEVVRRAVWLERNGADVIAGETRADFSGDPCSV
jgi:M6 family metalloprotease-like protein